MACSADFFYDPLEFTGLAAYLPSNCEGRANVALETIKVEKMIAVLSSLYEVHYDTNSKMAETNDRRIWWFAVMHGEGLEKYFIVKSNDPFKPYSKSV